MHGGDVDWAEGARVGLAERAAGVAALAGALGLHGAQIVVEAVAGDAVHQVQAVERVLGVGDPAAGIGAHAIVLDVVAGQRGAAEHDGDFEALPGHFLEVLAHDDGAFDQQAGHADGVRAVLARGLDHVGELHLDAEVDHSVTVIGQDDVDEVLADVVHVAAHGGEHDGAFLLALDPLHERFEIGDGGLHGLRGLQHEGELHLAGAEQLADDLHAVEQHVVDDVERGVDFERLVELVGRGPCGRRRRCGPSGGPRPFRRGFS